MDTLKLLGEKNCQHRHQVHMTYTVYQSPRQPDTEVAIEIDPPGFSSLPYVYSYAYF